MKEYHVEIVDPVQRVFNSIRARSGREAIEKALVSAGYKNAVKAWSQNTGVTYPDGKRPTQLVYRENYVFIHTIAWTI